jgi:hypothetical protein
LALAAIGVAVLTATLTFSTAYVPAMASWTVTGIGVGLAYPVLYLTCTSVGSGLEATTPATAVITAEAFGELLGRAGGGAVVSLATSAGASRTHGLVASYTLFTLFLVAAATAATRAVRRT